jgi:hypothetical protein
VKSRRGGRRNRRVPSVLSIEACWKRGEMRELAESGGLENRCAGNRTEGSNPSLSAIRLTAWAGYAAPKRPGRGGARRAAER